MLEYFLDLHPDELLYSVWARISDQARYANRGDVALELFGNRSFSALVDWSCSLGYLVSQLPEGHCYTADLLIDSHTLFPFYAPFLPPERAQLLRDQMTYGNGASFAARLGILTSGIPPHKWLRYCPVCVESDRSQFGEAYWHRLHQVPGVEVCPEHAVFLEESTAARGHQKQAFLSAERVVQPTRPRPATGSPLDSFLKDIAGSIDQLLDRTFSSPGLPFFQKQYFALLDHHGFITINGRLRAVEFLKAFTENYPPPLLTTLHCELSQTRQIEAEWPARLPFARRPQHPLHHILVVRFLGVPLETFLHFPMDPPYPFGKGPWPCLNPVCEQYRMPCIMTYVIREKSAKGYPAGVFACPSCGFTYSRAGPDGSAEDTFRRDRIPSYGRLWEIKLSEWWPDPSVSIEYMARRLGVDPQTVKLQAKKLALPPRRPPHKANTNHQAGGRDLEQQREQWLRLVEERAADGITALIRRVRGARRLYSWLAKYDDEWLSAHRPLKKRPQSTKIHLRMTFHAGHVSDKDRGEDRDVITSRAIRATAQRLRNTPGEPGRVTRAQLEKAIPSLGWLLSRPGDFPQTARAFQEVRETREAFALRRIQWAAEQYQEKALRPTRAELIARAKARRVLGVPAVQAALEEALTSLGREGR